MSGNAAVDEVKLSVIRFVREMCERHPEKTLDYLYEHCEVFWYHGVKLSFKDACEAIKPNEGKNDGAGKIWATYADLLSLFLNDNFNAEFDVKPKALEENLRKLCRVINEVFEEIDSERAKVHVESYTYFIHLIDGVSSGELQNPYWKFCNHCKEGNSYCDQCDLKGWYECVESVESQRGFFNKFDPNFSLPYPEWLILKWLKEHSS